MPTVRAKFRVASITGDTLKSIQLYAVTGGSPENERFFDASPAGSISLGTVNQDAAAQFELGKEFYVDFIPAEPAAAAA